MIVVSDATCVNHLIRSETVFILLELFGSVVIPPAVLSELQSPNTPNQVKDFLADKPFWLEVRKPEKIFDFKLNILDNGEREAIMLAEELHADLLLMDEKLGRKIAFERNLPVAGTLAVLLTASSKKI